MVDWDSLFAPAQVVAGIVLIAITSWIFLKTRSFAFGGLIVMALGFTLLALPSLESLVVGPGGLTIRIQSIVQQEVEAATTDLSQDLGQVAEVTSRLVTDVEALFEHSQRELEHLSELQAWARDVAVATPAVPQPPTSAPVAARGVQMDERIRDLSVDRGSLLDVRSRHQRLPQEGE